MKVGSTVVAAEVPAAAAASVISLVACCIWNLDGDPGRAFSCAAGPVVTMSMEVLEMTISAAELLSPQYRELLKTVT
jgi:hypothetical protein